MEYSRVPPSYSTAQRPGSAGSMSPRSATFGARTKSPLSISSSANYDTQEPYYPSKKNSNNPYYNKRPSSAGAGIKGRGNAPPPFSEVPPSPKSWSRVAEAGAGAGAGAGVRDMAGLEKYQLAQQDVFVPVYYQYAPSGRDSPDGLPPKMTTLMLPPRLSNSAPSSPTGRGFPRRQKEPPAPGDGFKKLPREILLTILSELRSLHLDADSLSCATCCMRDLCNVALSCRKWSSAARVALYEEIYLVGSDSPLHTKKKFKIKHGTRLKLLRRTLRARPDLANHVKVLKVPVIPESAKTDKEKDEYLDLVASLIMACPNLERLPGFYPTYDHEFSRLVHALSTRTRLTERVWIIDPNSSQQHRLNVSEDPRFRHLATNHTPLLPAQAFDFLSFHSNWPYLQTLILECNPGGMIDSKLFTQVFRRLPALQNLHVSSFPPKAFNDENLLALPALKKLRLENLPGISSAGLSTFASLPAASSLVSLSLIALPEASLPMVARLLTHLRSLESFTLWQSSLIQSTDMFIFHPYLASQSLKSLHWEITNPENDNSTEILASSISANGFPALRSLRAPADYEGTLQQLCRPRDRIELPGDRYRNLRTQTAGSLSNFQPVPPVRSTSFPTTPFGGHRHTSSRSSTTGRSSFSLTRPLSRQSSESLRSVTTTTSSSFTMFPSSPTSHSVSSSNTSISTSPPPIMINLPEQLSTSLSTARRLAQQRIDAARTQPKFQIVAWDEGGKIAERFDVGNFLGAVNSNIHYNLSPNVEGSDEAIVTVKGQYGLFDVGEEISPKDGCTGSWMLDVAMAREGSGKNATNASAAKREYWGHTERGRWRELPLDTFF